MAGRKIFGVQHDEDSCRGRFSQKSDSSLRLGEQKVRSNTEMTPNEFTSWLERVDLFGIKSKQKMGLL